ncbi:helix-turn-helix domain-containing protein [Cellulomonas sp. RIT-PI-Y]|uniref:helix-turn-helix domain-containing protein n=1 Tax=Cellulomonas sp. RIT-PI-Y TaxID=3035297 RepID=UPI0021D8F04D|nr:helix-turn-helix domain-containing protein [Cellulomonas sp. RIT-PI-Y]
MSTVLDVKAVAAQLGEDEQTVREHLRRGDLRGFKAGRGGVTSPWRVRQTAIDEYIALREAAARRGSAA